MNGNSQCMHQTAAGQNVADSAFAGNALCEKPVHEIQKAS